MKRIAAITILILAAMTAFAQGVRVDIPLWTSGPSVPVSGGPLPQSLLLANSTVNICVHPATASSCTPVTTYTDVTLATACPTNSPVVQLPGTACVSTTGPRGNLGFWYAGGVVDYFVHSSYGNFGPFTTSGGGTGIINSGQLALAQYPSATAASVSPSHFTYDALTGNNLTIPGTLGVVGTIQSNSIGSSPSTSTICPNGTGGALTTVGCAAGGGSGTVSGQTIAGVLPLPTTSTAITAQSHLQDCSLSASALACISSASTGSNTAIIPPGVTGAFTQYPSQQAYATCSVNNQTGALTIYPTTLGNGYTSPPTVTFTVNGALPTGSLGTIVASLTGNSVTSYSISGANSGWATSTLGLCPIRITVAAPPTVTAATVDVVNQLNSASSIHNPVLADIFGCKHDGVTDDSVCLMNAFSYGAATRIPIALTGGGNYHVSSVNGYFAGGLDDGTVAIAATLSITESAGAMNGCTVSNAGSNLNTINQFITKVSTPGTGGSIAIVLSGGTAASCTASGGTGYTGTFTAYVGPTCNGVPCSNLAPETTPFIPINIAMTAGAASQALIIYGNGAIISSDFTGSAATPTNKNFFTLSYPYTMCMGNGNGNGSSTINFITIYDVFFNNCFIGIGGGGAQQTFVNVNFNTVALPMLAANTQYISLTNVTTAAQWGAFFCGMQYSSRNPKTGNANGASSANECDSWAFHNMRLGLLTGLSTAQWNLDRQALDCYLDTYWVHYEDFGLTNSDACYTPSAGYTTAWGATARATDQDISQILTGNLIPWRGAFGVGASLNAYGRTIGGPDVNIFTEKCGASYALVMGPGETPTALNQISDEGQLANCGGGNQGLYGSATYPNPYEPYTNGPISLVLASNQGEYNLLGGSLSADAAIFPPYTVIHSNQTSQVFQTTGQGISQSAANVNPTMNWAGAACLWCDTNTHTSRQYQYAQGGNGITMPTGSSIGKFCNAWDVNIFTAYAPRCWTIGGKENQVPGTPSSLDFTFDAGNLDAFSSNDFPAYVRMPFFEVSSGPRLNGAVNGFTITNAGSGYIPGYVSCSIGTSASNIPGTSTPYQSDCAAWAGVAGTITDITCTKCGVGYTSAPAVTITAPVSGTTATATATVNTIGGHKQIGHWIFTTTYLAAGGTVPAYGHTTITGVTCQDAIFSSGNNGFLDYAFVVGFGGNTGTALIPQARVTAANTCSITLWNPTSAGIAYVAGSGNQPWIIELKSVNQTVSSASTSTSTPTNTNDGYAIQAGGVGVTPASGVINFVGSGGTTVVAGSGSVTITAPAGADLNSGVVERCVPLTNNMSCNALSQTLATSATGTAAAATTTSPFVGVSTSGTTTGNSSGWSSAVGNNYIPYNAGRNPLVIWGASPSNSTDFTSNSRVQMGLVDSGCTVATLTASDSPACTYALIEHSTTRSDTNWQCVTDTGSGTPTITDTGVAVTTAYTLFQINLVAGTTAACTVGSTTVTNNAKIPASSSNMFDVELNTITSGTTANHIRYGAWVGKSQNGNF